MSRRQQHRACDHSFGPQPCIEGLPIEMPAPPASPIHEVIDHGRMPTPEAQIAVTGAMTARFEAIVKTEAEQQGTEAGRSGLSPAEWPAQGTIDQQHIADAGSFQRQREARAGWAGAQNQHIDPAA
jgi:hypothetical protein